MMKRTIPLLLMITMLFTIFLSGSSVVAISAQDDSPIMINHEDLQLLHPRRGHSATVIGDILWITGGRAYYSHYLGWGQDGTKEFQDFPNIEWINLKTGERGYTDVGTGSKYYKSTAFTIDGYSPYIYIAANREMQRFNTETLEIEAMENIGELDTWNTGSWGQMEINGKKYVVIMAEGATISIFDPVTEKFIDREAFDYEIPAEGGYAGAVFENKFYIFGGEPLHDDSLDSEDEGEASRLAWVFDPNAEKGSQWKQLSDLPSGVDGPCVAVVGDKLYILAGRNMGEFLPTVYEYTPATDSYIRRSDLPYGSHKHAIAVYGDSIWVTYGYTWGLEEENKFGFRMHHPHVIEYFPLRDDIVLQPGEMKSIKGDKMNINLTWSEADHITGKKQSLSINWIAATSSTEGVIYIREKDGEKFEETKVKPEYFSMDIYEAHSYQAVLKNLTPDTVYEYYVESKGTNPIKSEIYTLRTSPENPTNFTFVVMGDTKAQYDVFNDLNGDILKMFDKNAEKGIPGFVGFTGDYGGNGAFIEYDAWFNYGVGGKSNTKEMVARYPMIHVHGNHERLAPTWWNLFNFPEKAMKGWPDLNNEGNEEYWYSYNYGNVHFVAFMSGYPKQEWNKAQLEWLKNDLARAKQAKDAGEIDWVVILLHHSIYTTSTGHMNDVLEDAGLMEEGGFIDIAEESGAVDVVFTAHDHNYERTKNIVGYRSRLEGELQQAQYYKKDNAYAEEGSGRFGEATADKGIIFITSAGAGAQNRDMYPIEEVGDSSWLAFRKTDPALEEAASTHPVFHYMTIDVTPDTLTITAVEKDVAHLEGWEEADDGFNGVLDSIVIRKPASKQ